jgi:hypothetical protein
MLKLKEMKSQREEELEGGWYTEERMERDLGYSKSLACNLTLSCCNKHMNHNLWWKTFSIYDMHLLSYIIY